jgi:hypothetical protein
MKPRQQPRKARRTVASPKRKAVRSTTASRRTPALERAHLSCMLCGRKGDAEVPAGTLLPSATHDLICSECFARHPADHAYATADNHRNGFKIIGRAGDTTRVIVVHSSWDPSDRRRGLAPCWIFDARVKKGWGPLPLLAVTRSGAWREWAPDDKEMRSWLSGFSGVRKDLRPSTAPPEPPPAPAPPASKARPQPRPSRPSPRPKTRKR